MEGAIRSAARVAYKAVASTLVRSYVRRELPGWGAAYRFLIGDYRRDWFWQGSDRKWVRGKLHGYEMSLDIGRWSNRATYFLDRYYDLPTQLLLQKLLRPGMVFIDVGANEGMMTLCARALVGEHGRIFAFEPNPAPRSILAANLERNSIENVLVFDCGLSDASGHLKLTVPTANWGEGSFGRPSYDSRSVHIVECTVCVGDELLQLEQPNVIKVDVEGFELRVLKGLTKVLQSARPVVITELVEQHLKGAGASARSLVDFMRRLDYSPYQLGTLRRRLGQELALTPLDIDAPPPACDVVWYPTECSAKALTDLSQSE